MARCQPTLIEGRQRLTPRELEIARLVADGLRNKEITERLSVTEGTVKIHLHNIYEKLGTNDRVRLALRVRSEGLV
jgi:DNA-binding NarL/FixJ family response regulator